MDSDDLLSLPSLDRLDDLLAAPPPSRLPFSDAAYEAHLIEDIPGEPVEDAAEIKALLDL